MLHGFFTLEDVQDYWWDSVGFFSCLANEKCFTVKKLIYLNQYLQTANNVYSFTLPQILCFAQFWSSGSCLQDYVRSRLSETKSLLSYGLGFLLKLHSCLY